MANQLLHRPHSTVAYAPCLAFFPPPMSSEQQRKAFPFSEFEPKWQDVWEAKKAFRTPNPGDADFDASKPKYFVLDMFPYPSGAGLHVGHPRGLHRHGHHRTLQKDVRLQRAASHGLGRLWSASRAIRPSKTVFIRGLPRRKTSKTLPAN